MVQQRKVNDWIDYIVDITIENCNGRDIVLWGKYEVADSIKEVLKEKYGKEIAFYVDGNINKIDGKRVFSADCLFGKSDKYYVVIPIAFYPSIREQLILGGYSPNVDYYYFCDCEIQRTTEYYEDAHGNRIIGKYKGLKFAFSGFHSIIEIGDNVEFKNTSFYIHSDSRIVIGDDTQFVESQVHIYHCAEAIFCTGVYLEENDINVKDEARVKIGCGCNIYCLHLKIGKSAKLILNEKVNVGGKRAVWEIRKNAKFEIGSKSCIAGGICGLGENALFIIGKEFSINENYRIVVCDNTSIFIGDDCMFSYDIRLRSNDGHSIFDIITGENINCSYSISRARKIIIGSHVWIGEGAEILYNTQIGDGSIIGTMSLVKNKIPNNCIAAGVPAKVIRKNITWSRQYGLKNIAECRQEYIHFTEEV